MQAAMYNRHVFQALFHTWLRNSKREIIPRGQWRLNIRDLDWAKQTASLANLFGGLLYDFVFESPLENADGSKVVL